MAFDATLPAIRLPADLLQRLEEELAAETARRPAESYRQADLVRTLLLEALDARAAAREGRS